jgi:AcrR family transcriptional regulator
MPRYHSPIMIKSSRGQRPYHHGNLPEVLADAAEAVVRELGVHDFSLRECARRAGVAHSAAGHHFGDVTGLLSEVAARGFDRLTASMRQERGAATGPEALKRIGRGYVAFALRDPAIFELMFHSDRVDGKNPRLQQAGKAAFAELVDAVAQARGSNARDEEALRFAWAGVHGAAMLLINGALPGRGQGSKAASKLDGIVDRIVFTVLHYEDAANKIS